VVKVTITLSGVGTCSQKEEEKSHDVACDFRFPKLRHVTRLSLSHFDNQMLM
jgi:hypothetical protein